MIINHTKKSRFNPRKLLVPAIIMALFWALAVAMWLMNDNIFLLINFGYIGTSLGLGLGLWSVLPKPKKPRGRRLAQFLIGGYLLVLVGFLGGENLQIEGFFFALMAGMFAAAVMHYTVAKIIGPVVIGRLWCGWACWTVMVLDLLPFKRGSGRLPGRWGWLRYLHFALSLGLVLILWFSLDYGKQIFWGSGALLWWFAVGNLFYYAIGIGLAFALKDNRAFCKYVCPITVPLKLSARFAMLRIKGEADKCNECGACLKVCPMDIQIVDYVKHNRERVLSTECILCQTCVSACARDALKLSFGFELGGKERLMDTTAKKALYEKARH